MLNYGISQITFKIVTGLKRGLWTRHDTKKNWKTPKFSRKGVIMKDILNNSYKSTEMGKKSGSNSRSFIRSNSEWELPYTCSSIWYAFYFNTDIIISAGCFPITSYALENLRKYDPFTINMSFKHSVSTKVTF